MKNNILSFIAGIVVFTLIAASTDSITIFKPAKPIQTKADWFAMTTSAISYIEQESKNGWQVQSITPNSQRSEYLVVLVKY